METPDAWLDAGRKVGLHESIVERLHEFTTVWSGFSEALRAYRKERNRHTGEALRDAAGRIADVQHNTATQVSLWPVMLHLLIYLDALDRADLADRQEEQARRPGGELHDAGILQIIEWRKQHPAPGSPSSPAAVELARLFNVPSNLATDDHLGHGGSFTDRQLTPPGVGPVEFAAGMAGDFGLDAETVRSQAERLLKAV